MIGAPSREHRAIRYRELGSSADKAERAPLRRSTEALSLVCAFALLGL